MSIRRGSNAAFKHIVRHGIAFKKLYRGTTELFTNSNPPVIASFGATPSTIDLDTRATGNVVFNFGVTNATKAEIMGPNGNKLWAGTGSATGSAPSYTNLVMRHYPAGNQWVYRPNNGNYVTNQAVFWIGWFSSYVDRSNAIGIGANTNSGELIIDGVSYPFRRVLSSVGIYPSASTISSTTGNVPSRLITQLQVNHATATRRWQVKFSDGRYINLNTGVPEASGAGAFPTSATLPQPSKTANYRLTAFNATGASHRDTTVTVTKDPVITNFRSTGANHAPNAGAHGATFRFEAIVDGLPRPTMSANQGIGSISDRHLTQRSDGRWDLTFTHYFGSSGSRQVALSATNGSGVATSRITVVVP